MIPVVLWIVLTLCWSVAHSTRVGGFNLWRVRHPTNPVGTAPFQDTWHLHVARSTNAAAVVIDGCFHKVPWTEGTVPVDARCILQVPECTPPHVIEFSVISTRGDHDIWMFEYEGVPFTGSRVGSALWVAFGEDLYIMRNIHERPYLSVKLEWDTDTVSVLSSGRQLQIPWRWPSGSHRTGDMKPQWMECSIHTSTTGTLSSMWVHSLSVNGHVTQGTALVSFVRSPEHCYLEWYPMDGQRNGWSITPTGATLHLQMLDLVRCRTRGMMTWTRVSGTILVHTHNHTTQQLSYSLHAPFSDAYERYTSHIQQPKLWLD